MQIFVVAKALVVNDVGELLVLRRSKTDTRRPGQLDFPGGRVEQGEDIRAAVIRETEEEAGITLKDPVLFFALTEVVEDMNGTWIAFTDRVQGRPEVRLSFEHDEYQWLPLAEVQKRLTYERQRKMVNQLIAAGLADKTT